MSLTDRTEGYWRSAAQPDLPMPVADWEWAGRDRFLACLENVETIARRAHTKGFSTCRICEKPNGSIELRLGGWLWGDGLRHYVADHGVRPSADFERFVTTFVR